MFKHIIYDFDLDYDDIAGVVGLNNNIPFEGLVYRIDTSTGGLSGLYPFKEGFKWGVCREWYETGQLKQEVSMIRGHIDKYKRLWHKNGGLKSEDIYVPSDKYISGKIISHKEWDEAANLIQNIEYQKSMEADDLIGKNTSDLYMYIMNSVLQD